jgi:hypothetical protein
MGLLLVLLRHGHRSLTSSPSLGSSKSNGDGSHPPWEVKPRDEVAAAGDGVELRRLLRAVTATVHAIAAAVRAISQPPAKYRRQMLLSVYREDFFLLKLKIGVLCIYSRVLALSDLLTVKFETQIEFRDSNDTLRKSMDGDDTPKKLMDW